MDFEKLASAVEAMIFVSDRPVSFSRLKEVFGETCPEQIELEKAVESIKEKYLLPTSGIELKAAQGGFHFVTKMDNASWVQKFQQSKPFRLGRSTLEALAIIAYRQPITRAEMDQIRGIDSSHLLRTLIERGLVKMAGKADVPGRPVQYATTDKFLETVGLASLNELPPLSELEQLQGDSEDPLKKLEEGLERFVAAAPTSAESVNSVLNDDKLKEIDGMIKSADGADREIYPSEIHAQIAAENQAIAQETTTNEANPKKRRKKPSASEAALIEQQEIRFEDLVSTEAPLDGASDEPNETNHTTAVVETPPEIPIGLSPASDVVN